ncbi:DUF2605 domain-containing protein [Spirulina sp. 06S082]|uniref:DUF2605 domain-containing protein n=1 Tax=Spirulina sp. 06S082 TaxID=3110248 RepID=UPI002B205444|nr:DUF2605 domain-containing protein [Spirulina sp. 06S082]MEA5472470.1 DUF2605 domain-containing protein [Spirulina sp. 06S082]
MSIPTPPESEILKAVLEPLLEDFLGWFSRSRSLLESESLDFLEESDRIDLLKRVNTADREVRTAQMMFRATEGKAGIDPSILVPWHRLVLECWQVSAQRRGSAKTQPGQQQGEEE